MEAPRLRAALPLATLDHGCANLPLEIPYSSENSGEGTYGQDASQSGPSHYSQPTTFPSSCLCPCPLSRHGRLAHLWHPRHVCLSMPAHTPLSIVLLCCFSDWPFVVPSEWPNSTIICSISLSRAFYAELIVSTLVLPNILFILMSLIFLFILLLFLLIYYLFYYLISLIVVCYIVNH